ncbi:MAG: hypothetical protein REH83_04350 [Rickettsiella sp.]|nr:hypothetical protein [Rickettsiella sp.]
MREFAKISVEFWTNAIGKKLKNCESETKNIAFYLMSSRHANMIGFYYLPLLFITHETGIPLEVVSKGIKRLIEIGFCSYDETIEYVWVHDIAANELGLTLKKSDNRIKHVNNVYKKLPFTPLLRDFYQKYGETFYLDPPTEDLKPLQSQEKKQEQNKEQKQDKKQENLNIILGGEHKKSIAVENKDDEEEKANSLVVKKIEPVVFTVPLRQGKTRSITENELADWQKNYPGIDVRQEIRHLVAWNQANPDRQKTERGINRHIQGWLAHTQQNQSKGCDGPPKSLSTWEHNIAVMKAFLEEEDETE